MRLLLALVYIHSNEILSFLGHFIYVYIRTLQDLLQETQIGQKELMRAIQSLALGKSQQRVLIWRNRRTDATSKDFSEYY